MIDISDFDLVKEKGEELYKTIGSAYCPYFKEKIAFNTLGMEHLRFKRRDMPRKLKDQYIRFKLINLAPQVLTSSYTLQGVYETQEMERIRINSRTDIKLLPVNYYEFIAVLKRNRVKVIVKQINQGERFFWSIIPFWKMNSNTHVRILHSGQLEQD